MKRLALWSSHHTQRERRWTWGWNGGLELGEGRQEQQVECLDLVLCLRSPAPEGPWAGTLWSVKCWGTCPWIYYAGGEITVVWGEGLDSRQASKDRVDGRGPNQGWLREKSRGKEPGEEEEDNQGSMIGLMSPGGPTFPPVPMAVWEGRVGEPGLQLGSEGLVWNQAFFGKAIHMSSFSPQDTQWARWCN